MRLSLRFIVPLIVALGAIAGGSRHFVPSAVSQFIGAGVEWWFNSSYR